MRSQRGSVSVEFAALMPLLAIAMLLVAQVGLLISEQIAVQHGAREGARAAATGSTDEQAREKALTAANLDPSRATISIEPDVREVGTPVSFTIDYVPVVMPVLQRFVMREMELTAEVTMRSEHER